MPRKQQKSSVVTFKADQALLEAMKGIPNRSEFIRDAVSAALDSVCPLCDGTGVLTPSQKNHWNEFAVDHTIVECDDCHEQHLVCANKPLDEAGQNG
ncbi:MAG: CopG family transcriptional regulator [Planctomycetota bacterium]|nr:MAG: CopG family transcriptional regulator [Planctomycetota bacterium]